MAALRAWLAERAPIAEVVELLEHKTRAAAPLLDLVLLRAAMTLFFFVVQVVTGALLLLYYRPERRRGLRERAVHHGARAVRLADPLDSFVVGEPDGRQRRSSTCSACMFLKAYRRPRELTWMSGMVLLGLVLAFGFTGYLLPWNELAFFATRVGTDIAGDRVRASASSLVRCCAAGRTSPARTLTRFFGLHVAILPGDRDVLVGLHLLLVQRHGMSTPPSVEAASRRRAGRDAAMPFLPHFLLRDLFAWTLALALLAALAAFFPWELGTRPTRSRPRRRAFVRSGTSCGCSRR